MRLDRVVVSTDADYIADVAREYGCEVIRRPDDIACDTAPIEESLRARCPHAQGERKHRNRRHRADAGERADPARGRDRWKLWISY